MNIILIFIVIQIIILLVLYFTVIKKFNILKEELKKAKENEKEANNSKKELVAALSHDIKTPIASIKALTELTMLKSAMDDERKALDRYTLEKINEKADQINLLVTEMFDSTLQELNIINVKAREVKSTSLLDMLKTADYKERVEQYDLSTQDSIIFADTVRLQQVFDNVIKNSYKYADTDIAVKSYYKGKYLVVDIQDYGNGVSEEDLPLIFDKFSRGKDTEYIDGTGLGMYLCKNFMEQMSGNIVCENRPDGFAVKIFLKLVG